MEMTDELAKELTDSAKNYLNPLTELLSSKGFDENQIGNLVMRAIETLYGLFLSQCLESEDDVLKVINGLENRILIYACALMDRIESPDGA